MERVILIIALALLGVMWIVITLKPAFTIELILRLFLPGYHLVKDRKKAKKKAKKGVLIATMSPKSDDSEVIT
jgi:hypothetical protein